MPLKKEREKSKEQDFDTHPNWRQALSKSPVQVYKQSPISALVMPLKKSGSNKARSDNISEMIRSGYPKKQAVAASYSNQRKYSRKKKRGGRS